MILDLKMITTSLVLLCAIVIQGAYGTIFPSVIDPPPIPSQVVRGFPQQGFNPPVDLPQEPPVPKEQDFYPRKEDEERWYYEDTQSRETRQSQSSIENFDRYYPDGKEAIGPVATPIPDDTYLVQSSSTSRINTRNNQNDGISQIFILTRQAEDRFNPDKWVEVQIPTERLIGTSNQEPRRPVASNTVKSIAVPGPFDISPKNQLPPNPAVNVVQIRQPNTVKNFYSHSPTVVETEAHVKQTVGLRPLQPLYVKNIDEQQIISDIPSIVYTPNSPAQIPSKKSFAVPPPPPPPIKGLDVPPKVISTGPVNIVPDTNIVISNKNPIQDPSLIPGRSVVQQVRHVWIPTSSRSGKFITIPISGSINSETFSNKKGLSLESTPVTVSDTWVLKQDGPSPIFERQKSELTPVSTPVIRNGKVIFQNPTIVQVNQPTNPAIIKQEFPENIPIIEKSAGSSSLRNIWPPRNNIDSAKTLNNYPPVITSDVPVAAVKSDTVISEKSVSSVLSEPTKTIFTETKPPLPFSIPPLAINLATGKPCPLPQPPLQKFPPLNAGLISLPRIISAQRNGPFARIIRVNRYPTGSYYLLNRNIRPSYLVYPNQPIIQQPKTEVINIAQNKQLPIPSFKTKQISIAFQPKEVVPALPSKQAEFPFASRQIILPGAHQKITKIIYPTQQAIRYTYPWNAYLNSNPILAKGSYLPQLSPFKAVSKGRKSKISSSESSSSEDSSESKSSSESSSSDDSSESKSKEKKEVKHKKEKSKKDVKPKSDENSNPEESGKKAASISNSKSIEKESVEKNSEKESEESLGTSESQTSLNLYKKDNAQKLWAGENTRPNLVSNYRINEH